MIKDYTCDLTDQLPNVEEKIQHNFGTNICNGSFKLAKTRHTNYKSNISRTIKIPGLLKFFKTEYENNNMQSRHFPERKENM